MTTTDDTGDEPSRDSTPTSPLTVGADDLVAPAGAGEVFGDRLPFAERYVEWLAGDGHERGLMGPRERPRLWDRHVLNCAAMAGEVGEGSVVVDVGTGAGLPGIPLALARPDLSVVLVEPLLRRVRFLEEVVDDLGLPIRVLRGRAEEKQIRAEAGGADVVTSRAVAPLAKLAGWSAPLLRPGGRLVALKGVSAVEEVERDAAALTALGLRETTVVTVQVPDAEETHLVVSVLADRMPPGRGRGRSATRRSGGHRRR